MDVSQFDGLIILGSPAEHEVAEALKKIERHMRSLATAFKRQENHRRPSAKGGLGVGSEGSGPREKSEQPTSEYHSAIDPSDLD